MNHYLTDSFPANTDNLAYNKPAIQISTSKSYIAGNAVDGDSYTYTVTSWENEPYWSVDLGMRAGIDHLYIFHAYTSNGKLFFHGELLVDIWLRKNGHWFGQHLNYVCTWVTKQRRK